MIKAILFLLTLAFLLTGCSETEVVKEPAPEPQLEEVRTFIVRNFDGPGLHKNKITVLESGARLRIVTDRPVRFENEQLGISVKAVPEKPGNTTIRPPRPGTYLLKCVEGCYGEYDNISLTTAK